MLAGFLSNSVRVKLAKYFVEMKEEIAEGDIWKFQYKFGKCLFYLILSNILIYQFIETKGYAYEVIYSLLIAFSLFIGGANFKVGNAIFLISLIVFISLIGKFSIYNILVNFGGNQSNFLKYWAESLSYKDLAIYLISTLPLVRAFQ